MKNDNPSNLFSECVAYWPINLIGIFFAFAGCSSGRGLSERQSFYFFEKMLILIFSLESRDKQYNPLCKGAYT